MLNKRLGLLTGAFYFLITKEKKIYWKMGIDISTGFKEIYNGKDLRGDSKYMDDFVMGIIYLEDGNYLNDLEGKWVLHIYTEEKKCQWLENSLFFIEKRVWEEFEKWKKELYNLFDFEGSQNFINPMTMISPPKKITKKHLNMVREWGLIESFMGRCKPADSVEKTIKDYVGWFMWESIWNSMIVDCMEDIIPDSYWDPLFAYIGSFFSHVEKWAYIDYFKQKKGNPFGKMEGEYPFKSGDWLWRRGLVPSYDYDSKVCRLQGGRHADVLWEGKL